MSVLCISSLFFLCIKNSETPWFTYLLYVYLCILAFPASRWLHGTSAATRRSTWDPCNCWTDRRGCFSTGSCSNWEPFTCSAPTGKNGKTSKTHPYVVWRIHNFPVRLFYNVHITTGLTVFIFRLFSFCLVLYLPMMIYETPWWQKK